MSRPWVKVALVVAALVLGNVWLSCHDARVRTDTIHATQADSLDHANADLQHQIALVSYHDRARADSLTTYKKQAAVAHRVAQQNADSGDTLLTLAVTMVPDTAVKRMIATADSSFHAALAAKDQEVSFWRAQAALWQHSSDEKDTVIARVNRALADAIQQRNLYRSQGHPGLIKQVADKLPWVAVSFLAGHFSR